MVIGPGTAIATLPKPLGPLSVEGVNFAPQGATRFVLQGVEFVGASGVPGLWLNTGHGASGWALACGCARAMADLIAQREPGVSLDGLGMRRF